MTLAEKAGEQCGLPPLFTLFFGEQGLAVSSSEFLNPPCSIDKFLFAGKKWVASRANPDFDIPTSRSGVIRSPACTNDRGLGIFGMYVRLHVERARK